MRCRTARCDAPLRRRFGQLVVVLVVSVLALTGWAVTWVGAGSASAAGSGDRDAEAAAWTRVVQDAQSRVYALTGHYVPIPDHTPAGTASAPPLPDSPMSSAEASSSGSAASTPSRSSNPSVSPAASTRVGEVRVGGWYAGSSGPAVTTADTILGVWADTSDAVQRSLPALEEVSAWGGAIDLAVGGTVLGSDETYAQAAAGDLDDRWKAAAKALAGARAAAMSPTFVRPWHEMNGDWYDEWIVTVENVEDYKKAFARFAGILRAAMPQVVIVWSPNDGTHTDLPVTSMYPGDEVVDVIAPDSYDWTPGSWTVEQVTAYINRGTASQPSGLESWRLFAEQHGKPVAVPEWGLCRRSDCGGDHPAYITAMHAWLSGNANTATWALGQPIPAAAAGKVLYSVYFNTIHQGEDGFTLAANPAAAATFRALSWGGR